MPRIGVSTAVGVPTGGGGGPFTIAGLTLSGWWEDGFAVPWPGTASAGASAAKSFATAGNDPTSGTAVNGHTPASLNGTSQYLVDTTDNWLDLVSTGAYSIGILFKPASAAAPGANLYDSPAILGDTGAADIGVVYDTNGVSAFHYDGDWSGPTATAAAITWNFAQIKYDGTNLKVRVNSGSWVSVPKGPASAGLAVLNIRFGLDWLATSYFHGDVLAILTAQSAISDANWDNIKAELNTRYGLAL